MLTEKMILAIEELLDEPGDEVALTQLVPMSTAPELAEISNLCKQLRNRLAATKDKWLVDLGGELDRSAHRLDRHLHPNDIDPQYNPTHYMEVCDRIWNLKEEPVD